MDVIHSPEFITVDYDDLPDDDTREIDMTLALMSKVQDMLMVLKNNSALTHDAVASLESISPGCIIDNPVYDDIDIFSEKSLQITMEYLSSQDIKLIADVIFKAGKNIGKVSAYIFRVVAKAANRVHQYQLLSKAYDRTEVLKETVFSLSSDAMDTVMLLDPNKERQLIKATANFTGLDIKSMSDVTSVMTNVKRSKNGAELLSNVYLPKYSSLVLKLYLSPRKVQKDILDFSQTLNKTIAPQLIENFTNVCGEIGRIASSRDWVGLAQLDAKLYGADLQKHVKQLSATLNVNTATRSKKYLKQSHKEVNALFKPIDKDDAPKSVGNMVNHLNALHETAKNSMQAVVQLSELSNKNTSNIEDAIKLLKELKDSKTLKESIANSHSVNKYSNQNFGRILKELNEMAYFINFVVKFNESVLNAHSTSFDRLVKLNEATAKYVTFANKLKEK